MKIKLHYSLIILIILSLLSGFLHHILIMYIIIITHELGHLIALKIYKRKPDSLIIFPYGGIIKYDDSLNKELKEEFIIAISGIFVNLILIFVLKFLKLNEMYRYNLYVLIFNALPILPLDGGRILQIILHKIFNYSKSLKIIHFISIIEIVFLYFFCIVFVKRISIILILTFLLIQNINDQKRIKSKYLMFILNKYLNPNRLLKKRIIKGDINNFYKGVNNHIIVSNKEFDEQTILNNYFLKH